MKDWTMLITTLGNRISSGNRTEEVDMAMWDTLFPLAKEEIRGSDIAQYSAVYQGNRYELFTCGGDPLCINKIIERITLNKKAKQIEWSNQYDHIGDMVGIVGDKFCYAVDYVEDRGVFSVRCFLLAPFENIGSYGTEDQAKQARQDHLQAYVDGLYSQLQELTEDTK